MRRHVGELTKGIPASDRHFLPNTPEWPRSRRLHSPGRASARTTSANTRANWAVSAPQLIQRLNSGFPGCRHTFFPAADQQMGRTPSLGVHSSAGCHPFPPAAERSHHEWSFSLEPKRIQPHQGIQRWDAHSGLCRPNRRAYPSVPASPSRVRSHGPLEAETINLPLPGASHGQPRPRP